MRARWLFGAGGVLVLALAPFAAAETPNLGGKKVAVVVFAQSDAMRSSEKSAQAHLESILADNGVEVLDERKAADMKNVWKQVGDPNCFITAESFVANAAKYEIQVIARVFLSGSVSPGLADYYTATAQADLQFVDQDAKVSAQSSMPMGGPGVPPSDGLTKDSAIANAVRRALEDACRRLGLDVSSPAMPRAILLSLEGPVDGVTAPRLARRPEKDSRVIQLANLGDGEADETPSCTATDPSHNLGAVGGYLTSTYRSGGISSAPEGIRPVTSSGRFAGPGPGGFRRQQVSSQRFYGSRVHVVDLKNRREIARHECHELDRGRETTSQVLDCLFLSSWRYLAAVTGSELFVWDTERGVRLRPVRLPVAVESAALQFFTDEAGVGYLTVYVGRSPRWSYRMARDK